MLYFLCNIPYLQDINSSVTCAQIEQAKRQKQTFYMSGDWREYRYKTTQHIEHQGKHYKCNLHSERAVKRFWNCVVFVVTVVAAVTFVDEYIY